MNNLGFEINRKSFHLMGLLCPIIYYFLPKTIAVFLSVFVAAFVVYIDIYRHTNPIIQQWVVFFFSKIMRENESSPKHLASASWMFIGIAISCILYTKHVAMFSWIILFVCDSAAAIIGSRYGTHKIAGEKTLEGSLSFFILTILLGLFFYMQFPASYSFISLVLAAIATSYTELYSKNYGIDDNVSIPIVAGICLSIF